MDSETVSFIDSTYAKHTRHTNKMLYLFDEAESILRYSNATLETPRFNMSTRVHDWRNHVPIIIKNRWDNLSTEAKCGIIVTADMAAELEEWD